MIVSPICSTPGTGAKGIGEPFIASTTRDGIVVAPEVILRGGLIDTARKSRALDAIRYRRADV
jgi:hypothetical protein